MVAEISWALLMPSCQLWPEATQMLTCVSLSAELRVEVEPPPRQMPREGSSSEYSSSSSSPMGAQAREESSDSAEENDRRKALGPRCCSLAGPGTACAVLTLFFSAYRCGCAHRGLRQGETCGATESLLFELRQTHGPGSACAE
jgi:hypothetical protein